mmetsp:Transcript_9562/g.28999  ORF Transcript_9562/g.28999 Transcript_9562/m.28999 type:complete len:93 (+) Transcript_9562:924-1202(+)
MLSTMPGQDSSLDSSSIGNRLVRVDALVQLLAMEQVLQHGLHLGDTRGASHKHDVMHFRFADLSITQDLLHRLQALAEERHAKLLKACTCQC